MDFLGKRVCKEWYRTGKGKLNPKHIATWSEFQAKNFENIGGYGGEKSGCCLWLETCALSRNRRRLSAPQNLGLGATKGGHLEKRPPAKYQQQEA